MRFIDRDRAVALQVGASILLAFIVLAIFAYQTGVVPAQNEQIEFNHNQEVQGQLLNIRNSIVSIPGGSFGKSVTVSLGTTFPERTIFVNPPPPVGLLRTSSPANMTLDNATTGGDAADFWDGTPRNFSTQTLFYRAAYRVYDKAPVTVYENTVLVNKPPNSLENLTESDQRLIRGKTITLIALNGTYQEAGYREVSVDIQGVSSSTQSIAVTDDGGQVTIAVPTTIGNETWGELLKGEYVSNGGHVVGHTVTSGPGAYNTLIIRLEKGVTYELRMAKVGIGSAVSNPGAAYVTGVSGDGASVATGENVTLIAEVRDRFNNPETGVTLNASVVDGHGTVTPQSTTGTDGQADFIYNSSNATTATIMVNLTRGSAPAETVNYTVTVGGGNGSSGGSGAAPSINTFEINDKTNPGRGARYDVTWDVSDPDGDLSGVTVYVNNTATGSTTTYSGASGTKTYDPPGSSGTGDTFEFRIVADDAAGNEACYVITDQADGSGIKSKSNGDGSSC